MKIGTFALEAVIQGQLGSALADYAWSILRRVLSWAYDRGKIDINHAIKPGRLYDSDRSDLIWLGLVRSLHTVLPPRQSALGLVSNFDGVQRWRPMLHSGVRTGSACASSNPEISAPGQSETIPALSRMSAPGGKADVPATWAESLLLAKSGSAPSQCEMVTGPGFSSPNPPDQERTTAYRDSSGPNSRSDAH